MWAAVISQPSSYTHPEPVPLLVSIFTTERRTSPYRSFHEGAGVGVGGRLIGVTVGGRGIGVAVGCGVAVGGSVIGVGVGWGVAVAGKVTDVAVGWGVGVG